MFKFKKYKVICILSMVLCLNEILYLLEIIVFEKIFAILILILMMFLSFLNNIQIGKMSKAVYVDVLTGLNNRRYIEKRKSLDSSLTIAIVDIDNFKRVNDIYGHDIGDEVLIFIANKIKSSIRKMDEVCRWGGEEFVIFLNTNELSPVNNTLERVRYQIEKSTFTFRNKGIKIDLTVSIGVSSGIGYDDVFKKADEALLEAKGTGKNKISFKN